VIRRAEKYSLLFGTAAGLAIAGSLLIRTPDTGAPPSADPDQVVLGLGPICTASREDVSSLLNTLPAAPFMSLAVVESLITGHTGPGPGPVLEQDAAQPNLYTLTWKDVSGKAHREGSPAIIVFDAERERITMEIWARHGDMHREGGLPATTEWGEDGRVLAQTWRENDQLHNETGPAHRLYDWDKDLLLQSWYQRGNLFRPAEKPSHTKTLISNGLIVEEVWATGTGHERVRHRADGLHILEHDSLTGLQRRRLYRFHSGMAHSEEFTYEILNNPRTGLAQKELWRKNDTLVGSVTYDSEGQNPEQTPDAASVKSLRETTRMLQQSGPPYGGHHHEQADQTRAPQ
jgi:hypothetical protein